MKQPWIALDWGTSNLRAWLLNNINEDKVEILSYRVRNEGVKGLRKKDFPVVLRKITKNWLGKAERDIFACGMVGSSIGWKEAPYCQNLEKLSKNLISIKWEKNTIHIIPGISYNKDEVMRGEESILLGFVESIRKLKLANELTTVVLPGTHSKWVEIENQSRGIDRKTQGTIQRFTTFMTGELFDLITSSSILKSTITGGASKNKNLNLKSFKVGLKEAEAGIISRLFKIRTNALLGGSQSDPLSRISGQLIGEEILRGLDEFNPHFPVYLLGESGEKNESLVSIYQTAFRFFKVKVKKLDSVELILKGISRIRNKEKNSSNV